MINNLNAIVIAKCKIANKCYKLKIILKLLYVLNIKIIILYAKNAINTNQYPFNKINTMNAIALDV